MDSFFPGLPDAVLATSLNGIQFQQQLGQHLLQEPVGFICLFPYKLIHLLLQLRSRPGDVQDPLDLRLDLLAPPEASLLLPSRRLPRGSAVHLGLSAVLHPGGWGRGGCLVVARCPSLLVADIAVVVVLVWARIRFVVSGFLGVPGGRVGRSPTAATPRRVRVGAKGVPVRRGPGVPWLRPVGGGGSPGVLLGPGLRALRGGPEVAVSIWVLRDRHPGGLRGRVPGAVLPPERGRFQAVRGAVTPGSGGGRGGPVPGRGLGGVGAPGGSRGAEPPRLGRAGVVRGGGGVRGAVGSGAVRGVHALRRTNGDRRGELPGGSAPAPKPGGAKTPRGNRPGPASSSRPHAHPSRGGPLPALRARGAPGTLPGHRGRPREHRAQPRDPRSPW